MTALAVCLPGMPVPGDGVAVTFRRDGSVREVGIADRRHLVPDLTGFRYIEQLIRRAGREIAALDLVAIERPGARAPQLGIPVLDEQATRAYRHRLADIDEDIDEATAMNDLARVEAARRDRAFLIAELNRACGIRGRSRVVGADAERARISVFRSLRYAIDRATAIEPLLGEHLRRSVRTGTMCAYDPDPLTSMSWTV